MQVNKPSRMVFEFLLELRSSTRDKFSVVDMRHGDLVITWDRMPGSRDVWEAHRAWSRSRLNTGYPIIHEGFVRGRTTATMEGLNELLTEEPPATEKLED